MKNNNRRIIVGALAALSLSWLAAGLSAQVRLPAVIGDHMVVQQDKPVAVWGWAGKNEPVTVLFNGQEKRTVAAADGTWRVVFDPLKAEAAKGPLEMTVRGAKGPAIVVKDILVGEVWVCSGQSNMEMGHVTWLPDPVPGHPAGRQSEHAPLPRPQAHGRHGRRTTSPPSGSPARPRFRPAFLHGRLLFRPGAPQAAGRPRRPDRFVLGRNANRALDAAGRVRRRPGGEAHPRRVRPPGTPNTATRWPRPCRPGRPGSATAARRWRPRRRSRRCRAPACPTIPTTIPRPRRPSTTA